MGFIIYYLVLIVNPMGRILVRWKKFRNNLEILCHPICNRLYSQIQIYRGQGLEKEIQRQMRRSHCRCNTYSFALYSFFLAPSKKKKKSFGHSARLIIVMHVGVYSFVGCTLYKVSAALKIGRRRGAHARARARTLTHTYTHTHICRYTHAHALSRCLSHVCTHALSHTSFAPRSMHVTCHLCESCRPNEWVMSHIWMSHVTHMNESCLLYEWVMSPKWMSHVSSMDESCHAYEWVMFTLWMSHVTYMNESCHTYEWVMSPLWMSHVTQINESCLIYEGVMLHIWMSHVTHANKQQESSHELKSLLFSKNSVPYEWVTAHTQKWVTSHKWMRHVTRMNQSRHTYERAMCSRLNSKSSVLYERVTAHKETSHITHANTQLHASHAWYFSYDSFICVTWRIHICDMTHSYVWHVSFISATWHIHTGDMTHSYVWHDSFTCENAAASSHAPKRHVSGSCHTHGWVTAHIWMPHVMHMNESCHTSE